MESENYNFFENNLFQNTDPTPPIEVATSEEVFFQNLTEILRIAGLGAKYNSIFLILYKESTVYETYQLTVFHSLIDFASFL